jgi:serine/threonine protein kinase
LLLLNVNLRHLFFKTENPNSNKYMMVMEYANMNNLRVFLRKEINLSWDTKLKLSLDIAKGLNYLHIHDIAHRDLVMLKLFI